MSDAITTQGFDLKIGNGDSPLTYTEVKEITSFQGFDGQAAEIPTTHLKSTAKEFLMGLQDFGNFNVEVNYVGDDPGQELMRDAKGSGEIQDFKATLSNGDIYTFQGFVMSSPISGGVDAKVDGSFAIRVSGDVVKT